MTKLDAFRAQLPERTKWIWLENGIALLVTPKTTYIVRDYAENGFGIWQELPNESIPKTLERIEKEIKIQYEN